MNPISKLIENGVEGSVRKISYAVKRRSGWLDYKYRNTPKFKDPTATELAAIEAALITEGIAVNDLAPCPSGFEAFVARNIFPPDYHGGKDGGVWREKLLEHWLSSEMLGLPNFKSGDLFIDAAAATSPWARIQRERFGVEAFAIDLAEIGSAYRDLSYYSVENATKTHFPDCSVRGVALHCAFELFLGEDDSNLIAELARILKPGGKAVILPLYMHTHPCAYSSPEYFGKSYPDPEVKQYVRLEARSVPSSRKYDAKTLRNRVINHIERTGMNFTLHALRNKEDFGPNIYCHFILEITR